MKKIRVTVSTNKVGSGTERVIEVEDDSTQEEMEQTAQETMFEMINWDWREVR